MTMRIFTLACLLFSGGAARGAEISTNGVGGGAWTDPATWRGKAVPGPGDDVVIRKHDVVGFDRNDDGKGTCRKLLIDPKGGVTFKTGAGKVVLVVAEGVESFGVIRLDGTRSATDDFELRLTGATKEKRQIKLGKGAALLLYGRAELPGGRRNVALVGARSADAKEPAPEVLVEAEGAVMIDWLRARVVGVKLVARKIDNTGARPNERIKVSDCLFSASGRVHCHSCDTPELVRNGFEREDATQLEEAALGTYACPLAEIKGNVVRGRFIVGIGVNNQSDSVVIDNRVEKCAIGIQGGYGIPNTMIKQATIRGCEIGLRLEGGSGVVEDVVVEGATTALQHQNATLQFTNFQVKDLNKKGVAVLYEGGTLTLLNCNVLPGQIKLGPPAAKPEPFPVTCLQYVVVGARGAPPGALVAVRTATPAPAAGAADPNVRNTPAPLVDGLTPLPRTLTPLVVKSWTLDAKGKVVTAPGYTLTILGPAPREGADRPVLKIATFRPAESAFRADPNDKAPTLEVSLR